MISEKNIFINEKIRQIIYLIVQSEKLKRSDFILLIGTTKTRGYNA